MRAASRVLSPFILAAVTGCGAAHARSVFDTPSRAYPLGAESEGGSYLPSDHAVADLNGNGLLDIVHGSFSGSIAGGARGFGIIFNRGEGTFAPPVFRRRPV
jgi:hypothetical protein